MLEYGSFTSSGTSKVLNLGYVPKFIEIAKADGSLVAQYVNGTTIASLKGTFAATFTTSGAIDSDSNGTIDFAGVTIGGLTDATAYVYAVSR